MVTHHPNYTTMNNASHQKPSKNPTTSRKHGQHHKLPPLGKKLPTCSSSLHNPLACRHGKLHLHTGRRQAGKACSSWSAQGSRIMAPTWVKSRITGWQLHGGREYKCHGPGPPRWCCSLGQVCMLRWQNSSRSIHDHECLTQVVGMSPTALVQHRWNTTVWCVRGGKECLAWVQELGRWHGTRTWWCMRVSIRLSSFVHHTVFSTGVHR